MKITSRFTVAVHTLLVIYFFGDKTRTTSEFIAESVNVNPVVIRRTLLSLKSAGMIEVKAGCGGARIVKDLKDITLYDVYTLPWTVWTGTFSISTKIPIPPVPWEKTSTPCWTTNFSPPKEQWRTS